MPQGVRDGNGDVPAAILKIIWGMLWNKSGPFYLPKLIAQGGGSISPLANQPVTDLGPFALFDKDPWGTVSINLKNAFIMGLSTIGDGGFTFDSSTQIFTAKLTFQSVRYFGQYVIDGSGLAGCAVAGVTGLLGLFPAPHRATAVERGNEFDDEHIVLARNYQSQLVNTPAGLSLVGAYYDNNDAMNEIVRGNTYFRNVFPTYKTAGKTSKDYANQTTEAAKAPDDATKTVGDSDYRFHSFLMQTAFFKSGQDLYQKTNDPKYLRAAEATINFQSTVNNSPVQGATTVGNVMNVVQSASSVDLKSAPRLTGPPPEEYRAALEELEADHARWLESNVARTFSELQADAAINLGQGRFWDDFGAPSLNISGTVTTTGTSPEISLVVNLTNIEASIPQINISLSTDLPGTLYEAVVNALANANFVKDLMNTRVNAALASPNVLSYLNDVINKAIAAVG